MIKVGLTGGIGSGKSTVTKHLLEMGIKVIDADIISREVLNVYSSILDEIRTEFGEEVFNEDNALNRKKLGSIVFSNEKKRKKLENIIIPYIKKEIFNKFHEFEEEGESICILDAPTLMENNLHLEMDYNILVWVDRETQIERVIKRDELKRSEVINRINAQMSLEDKKKDADFIIDNRGSTDETINQVEEILRKLIEMEN